MTRNLEAFDNNLEDMLDSELSEGLDAQVLASLYNGKFVILNSLTV